jgi:probable phosphoglycerate mutase
MGQVILARSATTDYDEEDRIVGTLDVPLNARGLSEVAEMARLLAGREIDAVYSTASESARESAKILGKELGVKVKELDDLTNLDFGLWQGLPVSEVQRKHRKLYKHWKEHPSEACPPAGEAVDRVYERVEKVLGPIVKKNSFRAVVVVAPDPLRNVIRCFLRRSNVDNVVLNCERSMLETIEV